MTPRARSSEPFDYRPHVLREYSLLADGERGAIIGPHGDVVWMCVPRWDSGAVFSTLIGGPGGFAITPQERFVWGGFYEEGSLIWRSHWVTGRGTIECREALAMPADPHRAVLLRRVSTVNCDAALQMHLDPCAEYGEVPLTDLHRHGEVWTARAGELRIRLTGAGAARGAKSGASQRLHMPLTVPAGSDHDVALEISDEELPEQPPSPPELWRATEAAWQAAVPTFEAGLDPRASRHSYAVLRGLTSASGGMVAAATTSLPERAEAGRNYDYRYFWMRDQSFAGQAAAAAGGGDLLQDAVTFTTARLLEHGDRLAPAYTTTGDPVPDQRRLRLDGYPGGSDLIGNWVNKQFQLDAFGEALLLLAAAGRHRLDTDNWRAAEIAAEAIGKRWTEPDAGIWEIDDQPWTHSRLTSVAGLRAISAHHPAPHKVAEWLALADRITADTASTSLHPDGHWQRSPTDPRTDGALLLPSLRGALPADDPRTIATLRAYTRELVVDGYAYRFRHDDRPLADAEGSFVLCGFLMALATAAQGRRDEAIGWWERSRAACGPPMLLAEEYDVGENQMRGNLPQAFVHALLLECSARLAAT
ncbi:MAG: glycoside hydrolase family 15 protein [Mycobacteriales bacterium]